MSNVKLAIRVRPFSARELKSEKDRIPVVNVKNNNTVTITNIKVSTSGAGDSRERVRQYFADYAFDSACGTANPAFASQDKVFESIGREVINSVIGGSSACVLAYGQSATGKTYTMMGSESQPGLIPRICQVLADVEQTEITVSFLEIYNEKVHDLLAGEESPATFHSLPRRKGNSRKDLRVREHPSGGPYVQNLRRVAVRDVTALLALVSEGTRRRRTAATRRNLTSSRSHALLELSTSKATLHLADLAGSEKASWDIGNGGGRQKEGANINKSLVALSNVISALVSRGRGRFVPYRDSALTWLLKDCFTGGASTFIIATVSPSVACYGESASTLRWAERARQLPTPRAVSVGSQNTRALLQAQYNQLIAELARNYIRYVPETGKIDYDDKHWALKKHENSQMVRSESKDTKIGNIMNIVHRKADVHNSESTASSLCSGSSDVINTTEKDVNLTNEINKEIDKLFEPTLERTRSGSDLEIIAPLRLKKRQCRSQEVLPINESLHMSDSANRTNFSVDANRNKLQDLHAQSNKVSQIIENVKTPIPILYDNQRAEIVASVTERLYSKLKKKEEAAVSKMESVVDRKIIEPLSELKICSNARQRLIELSQKAARHKRKIGIPAYTQTRKTVVRVKDQAIDIQTDLEPYSVTNVHSATLYKDVGTETLPMTPRYKEIAVGPKFGSLNLHDKYTATESNQISQRHSFVMTEDLPQCHRSVQTHVVPPPRRKKRASKVSKYNTRKTHTEEYVSSPVVSINIAQTYSFDSESQSSEDNIYNKNVNSLKTNNTMPPDLLTNHSNVDTSVNEDEERSNEKITKDKLTVTENSVTVESQNHLNDDFLDTVDHALPRVTVSPSTDLKYSDMKNIIMGRNKDVYPYNIVLSPLRKRDDSKKIVKFRDLDQFPTISGTSKIDWENDSDACFRSKTSIDLNKEDSNINIQPGILSDCTESSKPDSDIFIWKRSSSYVCNKTNSLGKRYTPGYNSKYNISKNKFYRDFLGLDQNVKDNKCQSKEICSSDSSDLYNRDETLEQDKLFLHKGKNIGDNKHSIEDIDTFENIEKHLLYSCDKLDNSVHKYEDYLANCDQIDNYWNKESVRTPTEYLQYLIQLRKEAIKAESDTDSSINISRK